MLTYQDDNPITLDMSMIDDYLEDQLKYEKKFNKKTVVLYEVGSFFEMYGIDNQDEKIGDVKNIAELLNIACTRKNKNILENNRKNPLMAGVNTPVVDKYLKILLQNNYTVVIVNQFDTMLGCKKERRVTEILSPGTYIEGIQSQDSNNVMSIHIESEKCYYTKTAILCIGLSVIDLTTGKSTIYEVYDKKEDKTYALDEAYRFYISHCPREVIIDNSKCNLSKEEIVSRFELSGKLYHFRDSGNGELYKIGYQNEFLSKVYQPEGLLTALEFLELEKRPYIVISLILLLNYVHEHNETLINNLEKPEIWSQQKYLKLDTNAIYQLNVIGDNSSVVSNGKTKYQSLFDVLNKTSTAVGRRLLKERLLNPVLDYEELERRYSYIEDMNDMDIIKDSEKYLRQVVDFERYHRKISLRKLNPYEFHSLHFAYLAISPLVEIVKTKENLGKMVDSDVLVDELNAYVGEYSGIFDLDEIGKYNIDSITNSFFKVGVYPEIDKIQEKLGEYQESFHIISKKLNNVILKYDKKSNIKLEHNDRDGYYLALTNKRCGILKKHFPQTIKVGDKVINGKEFTFTATKTSITKISCGLFKELSRKMIVYKEKLRILAMDKYLDTLENLHKKYEKCLIVMTDFIAKIDVIKSLSKSAIMYGYVKPRIVKKNKSYMKCRELRHPIIEQLHTDDKYIPNDVDLGDKVNGNLIYGLNGVGKTSYGKSIGLCCIMAQIGSYVPAEDMEYSPYRTILTRILGNDNMFKKQSSFVVEMLELRSILRRADENSLVIGDEICKGTEFQSGEALVASAIMKLSKSDVNFILATHMHSLSQMDEISSLENVKLKHMRVLFEGNKIVYDRRLVDGSGETIYGIEVASKIINDDDFIKIAYQIRNQRMGKNQEILSTKKSVYNSDVYVSECAICKKNVDLDVHHINFQCTADKNNMIQHFHKNEKHNLVVLCKEHHNEVHQGGLKINGYKMTGDGKILDYEVIVKKNSGKKKYTEEQIEIIKEMKNIAKMTQKKAVIQLKKDGINISVSTISKIWNGTY
jgi:DNA mismatch repair protein MutS